MPAARDPTTAALTAERGRTRTSVRAKDLHPLLLVCTLTSNDQGRYEHEASARSSSPREYVVNLWLGVGGRLALRCASDGWVARIVRHISALGVMHGRQLNGGRADEQPSRRVRHLA